MILINLFGNLALSTSVSCLRHCLFNKTILLLYLNDTVSSHSDFFSVTHKVSCNHHMYLKSKQLQRVHMHLFYKDVPVITNVNNLNYIMNYLQCNLNTVLHVLWFVNKRFI